ncbi:lysylphosphatidylglycerol synthase transmembrane domain-containing protein [Streptomyces sp. T028]|uniref:lysylphosphatidylglycerol synthase transmembrane domain-containing protein n=1 Tax=Streptomyces sp. T028 TaxID=3394379 RepID=UPI003A8B75EB
MTLLPLDTPVAPSPPPTPTPTPTAVSSRRLLTPANGRRALSLLPLLFLVLWAALDLSAVRDGFTRLTTADPWWLLTGLLFTYLGAVAAACVRQGAVPDRLPPGLLVASQIAAGAANHVLPASIGAHAVTVRFLRRQGIPLPRATASIALYSLVRAVAKPPVVLVFLLLAPASIPPARLLPDGRTLLPAVAGILLIPAGAAALSLVRPLRRPALEYVRTALTDVRHLHTRPSRFLPLWLGATAAPLIQASVVASVGKALDLPLTWPQLLFAFLAASTAAGAVPAPGGIGPIDAALVITLAGYGTPLSLATATVIGYRTLTVWLPLLPGTLLLSAMVQRKLL